MPRPGNHIGAEVKPVDRLQKEVARRKIGTVRLVERGMYKGHGNQVPGIDRLPAPGMFRDGVNQVP